MVGPDEEGMLALLWLVASCDSGDGRMNEWFRSVLNKLFDVLALEEEGGKGAGNAGPSPKETGLVLKVKLGVLGAGNSNAGAEVDDVDETKVP